LKANSEPLIRVFNSADSFVIPEFQRPYCWTIEEVEQLWNDLLGAYTQYKDKDSPKTGEEYFLGPLVLVNKEERVSFVVDGQQRLTTLHTLLWILKRRLVKVGSVSTAGKSKELYRLLTTAAELPKLRVDDDDQANFMAICEDRQLDETKPLGLMGSWLAKKVDGSLVGDEALLGFTEYVVTQVMFVLVETKDFSSAWDLFIGLNGKGRPLVPTDLIKAFICGNSPDSQAVAAIWNDRVLPLSNDATSAVLDITRMATGTVTSEAKLFSAFEGAWNGKTVTLPVLSEGALAYHVFWCKPLEEIKDLSSFQKRVLRGLRSLDRRDMTPVLLALAEKFRTSVLYRAELLAVLEAFQLWMAALGRYGRVRDFTSLAKRIHEGKLGEEDALASVRELVARLSPKRDEVQNAITQAAYPGKLMRFIIVSYEEGMRGDVKITSIEDEHMMPKTGTQFWFAAAGTSEPNEYARIVNNIGNMVPLDKVTNIAGRNDPWPVKCGLYLEKVPRWSVADLARKNLDGWTTGKIRLRAAEIAEWAVATRWNLESALQQLPEPRNQEPATD
jgi:hypothetical protein